MCGSASPRLASPYEPLYRCRACGFVDHQRSLSRSGEERLYTTAQEAFDSPPALAERQWRWVSRLASGRPGTVFDVGCGTGTFLVQARRAGWSAHGVELNPRSACLARERLGSGIHTGSLYDCQKPVQPYDLITMWDVLDHLSEPHNALRTLADWLAPDGTLVVRVRNAAIHLPGRVLYFRFRRLANRLGWKSSPFVVHRYGFTLRSLRLVLADTGFGSNRLLPMTVAVGSRRTGFSATQALLQALARVIEAVGRLSHEQRYYAPSILVAARVSCASWQTR